MFNSDQYDITSGLNSLILSNVNRSIEDASKETFSVFKKFIRQVITRSIVHRSLKHFNQYISFYPFIYSVSYKKMVDDENIKAFQKFCSEQVSLSLKEIISWDISYIKSKEKDINERKRINQFYYSAYNSFSTLLYYMLKNNDLRNFAFAINEYENISPSTLSNNYNLKTKIKLLTIENKDGRNDSKILSLKNELSVSEKFNIYYRHVLLGIKYWIFYLYQYKKLDQETALAFLDLIKTPISDPEDTLKDIIFFREGRSRFYMGWEDWDIIERKSGKVYTPPDPYYWLTMGFMADQIRENRLFINTGSFEVNESSQIRYLYDKLVEVDNYFIENFSYWKDLLKTENIDDLKEKSKRILVPLSQLKTEKIGDDEKEIAQTPLDDEKIDFFKSLIGSAWEGKASIRALFNHYKSKKMIPQRGQKLKIIGQRTFFEKAKMMFIKGKHHQDILNVNQMGGIIGTWENAEFFDTILKSECDTIYGKNSLEIIEEAILSLSNRKFKPNFILMSREMSYSNNELLDSEFFISKFKGNFKESAISTYLFGTYKKIPIFVLYSDYTKNRIIVANFKQAFTMLYKKSRKWYNDLLKIDINLVSDQEAERRLEDSPHKWSTTEDGVKLSKEDAITLIKTSVIIDIWSTTKFIVKNKKAFIIGQIGAAKTSGN